jgi:hypothetical protein
LGGGDLSPTFVLGEEDADGNHADAQRERHHGVARLMTAKHNLAMFTAMRRASSRVSIFAADRWPGSSSKIDIGERLLVGVADDVAVLAELGVRVIDGPGR